MVSAVIFFSEQKNVQQTCQLEVSEETKFLKILKVLTENFLKEKCRIIKRKRTTTIRWSQKTNDMCEVIVMSPDRDVWALTPRPKSN